MSRSSTKEGMRGWQKWQLYHTRYLQLCWLNASLEERMSNETMEMDKILHRITKHVTSQCHRVLTLQMQLLEMTKDKEWNSFWMELDSNIAHFGPLLEKVTSCIPNVTTALEKENQHWQVMQDPALILQQLQQVLTAVQETEELMHSSSIQMTQEEAAGLLKGIQNVYVHMENTISSLQQCSVAVTAATSLTLERLQIAP